MDLKNLIPSSWQDVLSEQFGKPYWDKLEAYLEEEMGSQTVYPPKEDIFRAFEETSYNDVRVLLLGQDPYHGPGQGHGLSFSVQPKVTIPPSLRNVYKELVRDLECAMPNNGYLMPWCKQGVMLLNAILTVRARDAGSHKKAGWGKFTDAVIKKLNERDDPVVFLLWGGFAKKKARFIDDAKHRVIQCPHPSPLAKGFVGSGCFTQVNDALTELGKEPIDWQIPNI
ncbi:MAG: uracil-DNA glycosylase [Planctomycetota bacterium]|nr:uracil-DNA glycosylase [Planctomycetota bacterium]